MTQNIGEMIRMCDRLAECAPNPQAAAYFRDRARMFRDGQCRRRPERMCDLGGKHSCGACRDRPD